MPASSDFVELVRCPACGASASAGEASLDCTSCGAVYPIHAGIPWLYRDVAGSRAQWAAKLQRFRTELLADLDELEAALAREDLVDSTRERLARQRAGLERFGEQVMTLLAPFAFEHGEAGAVLPADRIPSAQHVTSYLDTAYRNGRGDGRRSTRPSPWRRRSSGRARRRSSCSAAARGASPGSSRGARRTPRWSSSI
jgi:uncharacterized protein YbaR (Trm112 family)